jgi:hypothetical protein
LAKSAVHVGGAGDAQQHQERYIADLAGVTADDLNAGCCWFRVCCTKCICKHRHACCKVGEYCGVFVVVEGCVGQEMLSRLTLVMLDFAQYKALAPKLPYSEQAALMKERGRLNAMIQRTIADTKSTDDPTELGSKQTRIEALQKMVTAIDAQLTPGQGQELGQAQTSSGSPLSTWQKMNVLLNPSVPSAPAPAR